MAEPAASLPDSAEAMYCVNHPDRAAIERCEVCGQPLCGYCLYYTDDGQRLCKEHAHQAEAQGVAVIPPAVYAAGIIPAQARASEAATVAQAEDFFPLRPAVKTSKRGTVLYQANNNDLTAFVAVIISVFSLAAICGFAVCLPIVGFLLSLVALMNAKDAVDPRRTRQQGFIALAITGLIGLGIVVCIVAYGAIFWSAFQANNNFQPVTIPTFQPLPTRTFAPIATSTPSPTPTPRPAAANPQDDLARDVGADTLLIPPVEVLEVLFGKHRADP